MRLEMSRTEEVKLPVRRTQKLLHKHHPRRPWVWKIMTNRTRPVMVMVTFHNAQLVHHGDCVVFEAQATIEDWVR